MEETTNIAIFKGKKMRKIIYQNGWYFSVVDVVEVLTDSNKPRVYWNAMKTRVKASDGIELSTICRQLKLEAPDGKKYKTDCANTEGIFRIIQSIPSPKAEPFKRWLARVRYYASLSFPLLSLSFPRKWESRNYLYRFPIRSGMTNPG